MRRDVDPRHVQAACRSHPQADEVFFPTHTQGRGARRACEAALILCYGCPVKDQCLEDVLTQEKGLPTSRRFGVYGATTPQQRSDLDSSATARVVRL